jgi:hypothetical protein
VLVAKNLGDGRTVLWDSVRRAVVALDPKSHGDEEAFCAAYDASEYAPHLR